MIFKQGDWVRLCMPIWFVNARYGNGLNVPNGTKLLLLEDLIYRTDSTDLEIFVLCELGCTPLRVRFDELVLLT